MSGGVTITARAAAVGSGASAPVPPLTITAEPGVSVVIAVEGDDRPMHVSLLLAGRLAPDSGEVLVDGRADRDALRRRTALVDTPMAAEPDAGLPVRLVVTEELQFAGVPARRRDVDSVLAHHGIAALAREPFRALATDARIRLLTDLALRRPGVDALIITSPERHGGDPAAWFPALAEIAAEGRTVIIVTDAPTAKAIEQIPPTEPTPLVERIPPIKPTPPIEPSPLVEPVETKTPEHPA